MRIDPSDTMASRRALGAVPLALSGPNKADFHPFYKTAKRMDVTIAAT